MRNMGKVIPANERAIPNTQLRYTPGLLKETDVSLAKAPFLETKQHELLLYLLQHLEGATSMKNLPGIREHTA